MCSLFNKVELCKHGLKMPTWKRVYPIISGVATNVEPSTLRNVMDVCKVRLPFLFTEYCKFTRKSYKEWLTKDRAENGDQNEDMHKFLQQLSVSLDLETEAAVEVLTKYLTHDYYGKIEEVTSIVRFQNNATSLLENIWHFYSAERMFTLKTLRHILENAKNPNCPLQEEFQEIVNGIDFDFLWANLMETFRDLIEEIDRSKIELCASEDSPIVENWMHRNVREQVEVVMLMILCQDRSPLSGRDFADLVKLFVRHDFGRSPLYNPSLQVVKDCDLDELKCAEISCILLGASRLIELMQNPQPDKETTMLTRDYERTLETRVATDESIVLLAWLVIKNMNNTEEDENPVLEQCSNLCETLLDNNVFIKLHSILTNKIFHFSYTAPIICKAVAIILKHFWAMIDDEHYLYRQEGFIDVFSVLLSHPELVEHTEFMHLHEIFNLSLEQFPYDFDPLVKLCSAVLKSKSDFQRTYELITNLPHFYNNTPWPLEKANHDWFTLDHEIVVGDTIIAPIGSLVRRILVEEETPVCLYNFNYSFYTVFEEHVERFLKSGEDHVNDELFEKVSNGFDLLVEIVRNYVGNFWEDPELLHSIDLLDKIPKVFVSGKSLPVIRMYLRVQNCFLIDVGMAFENLYKKNSWRKFFPKLFAKVPTGHDVIFTSFREMFEGDIYFDGVLVASLYEEEKDDDHGLLVEYMRLIHFMMDRQKLHRDLQVAGYAFVVTKVFPNIPAWRFESNTQHSRVTDLMFSIFVKILQRDPVAYELTEDESRSFHLYLKIFANDEWFITHFMHEFSKDKFYVQRIMQHEIHWFGGAAFHLVETLRASLLLVILVLKHKSKLEIAGRTNLERNIGAIAKAATCHMINPYNRPLAAVSLRFLDIICKDEETPLMPLLELDAHQVQRTFLERLRDSLEDATLKANIIDFVGSCVLHQNGITAAFFNVQCSQDWSEGSVARKNSTHEDDMKDFMVDYFQNMKVSRTFLKHPLQLGILRIICYLWRSNKEALVKEIYAHGSFWHRLAQPLFEELDQQPQAYGYILEIISTHLHKSFDRPVRSILDKFLSNETLVTSFSNYVLEQFRENPNFDEEEEGEGRLYLLKTLTSLFVAIHKKMPLVDNISFKAIFVEMAFTGVPLVTRDPKMLVTWLNFAFGVLTQWGINPTRKHHRDMKPIMEIYQAAFESLQKLYHTIDLSTRNIILSSLKSVIEYGRLYLEHNTVHLWQFLNSLSIFMDFEYRQLSEIGFQTIEEDPYTAKHQTLPWLLCASISNSVLKFRNAAELAVWFRYRNYIDAILVVIPFFLKDRITFSLAKVPIHGLILYMMSPLYFDLCQQNLIKFYDDIEPLVKAQIDSVNLKTHPLVVKDGWLIVSLLIQFNRELLKRYQLVGMKTICAFFMMFHHTITYNLSIPEFTVDLDALSLLKQTLALFDEVLTEWHLEWYKKSNRTFNEDITNLKKVINACISVVLRPKSVVYYKLQDEHLEKCDTTSAKYRSIVVNEVISILSLCFNCLYKINPALEAMLDVVVPSDVYYTLIEHDFSVPKFDGPINNELTYGRLLCLAHFLCKTLNQLQQNGNDSNNTPFIATQRTAEKLTGIIESNPTRFFDPLPQNQNLTNFLSYAMYQFSGLTVSWIARLDTYTVKHALESLLMFLGGQVFLHMNNMDSNLVPFFKRNLYSELQFFYEYCKKHSNNLYPPRPGLVVYQKTDWDTFKQIMVSIRLAGCYNNLADCNFLLVLGQWFTNICSLN